MIETGTGNSSMHICLSFFWKDGTVSRRGSYRMLSYWSVRYKGGMNEANILECKWNPGLCPERIP